MILLQKLCRQPGLFVRVRAEDFQKKSPLVFEQIGMGEHEHAFERRWFKMNAHGGELAL